MPSLYPQLNTAGMMVQRPFGQTFSHLSSISELAAGARQSYYWRNLPLMTWDLTYPALAAAEYTTVHAFHQVQQGRFGEFIFLDPGGNLVPASENFADSSWTKSYVTIGAATTDPFGGNNATACTGTSGSNSCLVAATLPSGLSAGLMICLSAWVRPHVAMTFYLIQWNGVSSSIVASAYIPANQWVRLSGSLLTVNTNVIFFNIGGYGCWTTQAVDLFGAQCVPMGGPGAYQKTPGNYGYHPKVRFDTDVLMPQYVGPDQVSLKLRLAEYV